MHMEKWRYSPHILNFGTKWKRMVGYVHTAVALHPENEPQTHRTGGWASHRAGQGATGGGESLLLLPNWIDPPSDHCNDWAIPASHHSQTGSLQLNNFTRSWKINLRHFHIVPKYQLRDDARRISVFEIAQQGRLHGNHTAESWVPSDWHKVHYMVATHLNHWIICSIYVFSANCRYSKTGPATRWSGSV
jgi:hypothetical protein